MNDKNMNQTQVPTAPGMTVKNVNSHKMETTNIPVFKSTTKHSGLTNQGSTCYLNSLLQSLYMTPEFRLNLFNWKFNELYHGYKADCIPYQLQKLFARLQLRLRNAEETIDLTKSFQWSSSDVFLQHDIQELCRKLFEAIESSMIPDEHNFINELYEGTSSSVVRCQECNYLSEKFDKFLDITLPIRNDFDKIYNKSLGMAFKNFVKPELLNNDNQYFCEKCDKKVDALKYMKFAKLPKILFISLSRFEYDFMTDGRKKINDKVNFPLLLNFNNYIKDFSDIQYDENLEENDEECLLMFKEEDLKVNNDNDVNVTKYKEKLKEYLTQGPLVYELFSVVVHSGNAMGGHYFAYIKSFEDGLWYSFNDSNVCELKVSDIKTVFGGNSNRFKYSSSTTGYVVMYRQVKTSQNGDHPEEKLSIDDSLINEDVKKDIDSENLKIINEEIRIKEKLNDVTLGFYYDRIQKTITVKKTDSVNVVKILIMKEFNINDKYIPEDVRIRAFHQNKPHEFFHEEDKSLEMSNIQSYKTYTIDVRNKVTGLFEEFDPDRILIQIFVWKDEYEDRLEKDLMSETIQLSNKETLLDLKKRICYLYNFNPFLTPLFVFKKVEFSSCNFSTVELFKTGDDLSKELFRSAILDGCKIYVELKTEINNFESKFFKIFAEKLSNYVVKFNFPVSPSKKNITIHDYKMENEIEINKNSSMKIVKDKIAEYLVINPHEFRMKKYNHNATEIKNLQETLISCTNGILSSLSIYIELGTPMKELDLKINLFLAEYEYSTFNLFPYKLTEIGPTVINTNMTVAELKIILIQEIKDKIKVQLDYNYVILRESVSDRPARILHESIVIQDLDFGENKKIIVQEYIKEKINFLPDQLQFVIRFWDVENWELSEVIETHITKSAKLLELAELIGLYFPDTKSENLGVHKIVNGYNVYMDDINKYEFVNLYEKCDMTIDRFPFFLKNSGNLLIIRDMSKTINEPSIEKLVFFTKLKEENKTTALVAVPEIPIASRHIASKISETIKMLEKGGVNFAKRINTNGRKTKERGIVIKVIKNKEETKHDRNIHDNQIKEEKEEESKINNSVIDYSDYLQDDPTEFGPLI